MEPRSEADQPAQSRAQDRRAGQSRHLGRSLGRESGRRPGDARQPRPRSPTLRRRLARRTRPQGGGARDQYGPAAILQQVATMLDSRAASLGDNPAIAAAVAAVKVFLTEPHSLTIELAPTAPVAFTALKAAGALPPADVAALIGLKVSANK